MSFTQGLGCCGEVSCCMFYILSLLCSGFAANVLSYSTVEISSNVNGLGLRTQTRASVKRPSAARPLAVIELIQTIPLNRDGKIYLTVDDQGHNQLSNYTGQIKSQRLPTAAELAEGAHFTYQGKVLAWNAGGSVASDILPVHLNDTFEVGSIFLEDRNQIICASGYKSWALIFNEKTKRTTFKEAADHKNFYRKSRQIADGVFFEDIR